MLFNNCKTGPAFHSNYYMITKKKQKKEKICINNVHCEISNILSIPNWKGPKGDFSETE